MPTPADTYTLWREQERLERLGWSFQTMWLRGVKKYAAIPYNRGLGIGRATSFVREDRADALTAALEWAARESDSFGLLAAERETEKRDTLPAPPPVGAE